MRKSALLILIGLLALALAACSGGGTTGPTPPVDNFTRMTAQVADGAGNPLNGLAVRIDGQATGVTTDGTGNFTLERNAFRSGVTASHELSFGRNGLVLGTFEVVPSENPTPRIQFGNTNPGADMGGVSGMVFDDQTRAPLAGVEISLFSEDGGVYETLSGLEGYDFVGVPAGDWNIAASKAGYHPEMARVRVTAGDVTIQHLAMTPDGRPDPGQGLIVRGTLTDEDSGAPIAGASISMYTDTGYYGGLYMDDIYSDLDDEGWGGDWVDGGAPEPMPMPGVDTADSPPSGTRGASMAPYMYDANYQETTTDENGVFEFDEVVGYMVWLDYFAEGYLNGSHQEYIDGETGAMALDLTLDAYVQTDVSGTITDNTGAPIPGAYVEFIYAGDMFYEDVPVAMPGIGIDWEEEARNWEGNFDAPPPPMAPGMDGANWDDMDGSPAMGGGQSGNGGSADNMLMMRFRWENQQNSGTRSASDAAYFNGYYATNADENGNYTFEGIPAGSYHVFASAYRHIPVNDMVELSETETNTVDFELEPVPVGAVDGYVMDENGQPVADALVNATQPNVDPFSYTDETGYFIIENVPAGMWFISGYKVGYLTESIETEISADQTVTVNLILETYIPPQRETIPYGGEVINGNDATKVPQADIVFTPVDNALGSYYQHVVSGPSGGYSTQLLPTEYNVLVQAPGFEDIFIRIWVDRQYPSMDFWLWPVNSGGGGGWGGMVEPMPFIDAPMEGGAGAPDTNFDGGTEKPREMPELPKPSTQQ